MDWDLQTNATAGTHIQPTAHTSPHSIYREKHGREDDLLFSEPLRFATNVGNKVTKILRRKVANNYLQMQDFSNLGTFSLTCLYSSLHNICVSSAHHPLACCRTLPLCLPSLPVFHITKTINLQNPFSSFFINFQLFKYSCISTRACTCAAASVEEPCFQVGTWGAEHCRSGRG